MLACACVQVALECRHTQGYQLYRWQFKEHRNCHARKKEDIDHMQAGRYEGGEIADLGRLDGWEGSRSRMHGKCDRRRADHCNLQKTCRSVGRSCFPFDHHDATRRHVNCPPLQGDPLCHWEWDY